MSTQEIDQKRLIVSSVAKGMGDPIFSRTVRRGIIWDSHFGEALDNVYQNLNQVIYNFISMTLSHKKNACTGGQRHTLCISDKLEAT